jgi:hypothetical protein
MKLLGIISVGSNVMYRLVIESYAFIRYRKKCEHNKIVHNGCNMYPSTLRTVIKSMRVRWAGHVARRGRRGTLIDYWLENQRERDH